MEHVKCLILGSGPAGYTAGLYAGRAGLSPILYDGIQRGGLLTQTTEIENFPGYPNGIDANIMMEELRQQAERFGTECRSGSATKIDVSTKPYQVSFDDGSTLSCSTLIIATGASPKKLGLPDEEKYNGIGVSACATCDGFFYRKKVVAVVGGGDSACEEASYLAGLASKVHLIVRKDYLRASKVMQERVLKNPKIEVHFETNTLGLFGEGGVEGGRFVYRKGEADEKEFELPIDGFFLAIGHKPNTDLVKDFIDLDEQGYIKTNGLRPTTNIPGVYAAGDVADPIYRQAITAAASGCRAAMEAIEYLQDNA